MSNDKKITIKIAESKNVLLNEADTALNNRIKLIVEHQRAFREAWAQLEELKNKGVPIINEIVELRRNELGNLGDNVHDSLVRKLEGANNAIVEVDTSMRKQFRPGQSGVSGPDAWPGIDQPGTNWIKDDGLRGWVKGLSDAEFEEYLRNVRASTQGLGDVTNMSGSLSNEMQALRDDMRHLLSGPDTPDSPNPYKKAAAKLEKIAGTYVEKMDRVLKRLQLLADTTKSIAKRAARTAGQIGGDVARKFTGWCGENLKALAKMSAIGGGIAWAGYEVSVVMSGQGTFGQATKNLWDGLTGWMSEDPNDPESINWVLDDKKWNEDGTWNEEYDFPNYDKVLKASTVIAAMGGGCDAKPTEEAIIKRMKKVMEDEGVDLDKISQKGKSLNTSLVNMFKTACTIKGLLEGKFAGDDNEKIRTAERDRRAFKAGGCLGKAGSKFEGSDFVIRKTLAGMFKKLPKNKRLWFLKNMSVKDLVGDAGGIFKRENYGSPKDWPIADPDDMESNQAFYAAKFDLNDALEGKQQVYWPFKTPEGNPGDAFDEREDAVRAAQYWMHPVGGDRNNQETWKKVPHGSGFKYKGGANAKVFNAEWLEREIDGYIKFGKGSADAEENSIAAKLIDPKGKKCYSKEPVKVTPRSPYPMREEKDVLEYPQFLLLEKAGKGCRLPFPKEELKRYRDLHNNNIKKAKAARVKPTGQPDAPTRKPTPGGVDAGDADDVSRIKKGGQNHPGGMKDAPDRPKSPTRLAKSWDYTTPGGAKMRVPIEIWSDSRGFESFKNRCDKLSAGIRTRFSFDELYRLPLMKDTRLKMRFLNALVQGYGKKIANLWLTKFVRGVVGTAVKGLLRTTAWAGARMARVATLAGTGPIGWFAAITEIAAAIIEVKAGPNCHSAFWIMHNVEIFGTKLGLTEEEECALQDNEAMNRINVAKLKDFNGKLEGYLNLFWAGDVKSPGTLRPWKPGDAFFPPQGAAKNLDKTTGISIERAKMALSTLPGLVWNPEKPGRLKKAYRGREQGVVAVWTWEWMREPKPGELAEWLSTAKWWLMKKSGQEKVPMFGDGRKYQAWVQVPGFREWAAKPLYAKYVEIYESEFPWADKFARHILSGERAKWYYEAIEKIGPVQGDTDIARRKHAAEFQKYFQTHKESAAEMKRLKSVARGTGSGAARYLVPPFWMYMMSKYVHVSDNLNTEMIRRVNPAIVREKERQRSKAQVGTPLRPYGKDEQARVDAWGRLIEKNGKYQPPRSTSRRPGSYNPQTKTKYRKPEGYHFVLNPQLDRDAWIKTGVFKDNRTGKKFDSRVLPWTDWREQIRILDSEQWRLSPLFLKIAESQFDQPLWNRAGEALNKPGVKRTPESLKAAVAQAKRYWRGLTPKEHVEQRKYQHMRDPNVGMSAADLQKMFAVDDLGNLVNPNAFSDYMTKKGPYNESQKPTVNWQVLMEEVGPAPKGKSGRFFAQAKKNRINWSRIVPIEARVRPNAEGEWDPNSEMFGLTAQEVELAKAGKLKYKGKDATPAVGGAAAKAEKEAELAKKKAAETGKPEDKKKAAEAEKKAAEKKAEAGGDDILKKMQAAGILSAKSAKQYSRKPNPKISEPLVSPNYIKKLVQQGKITAQDAAAFVAALVKNDWYTKDTIRFNEKYFSKFGPGSGSDRRLKYVRKMLDKKDLSPEKRKELEQELRDEGEGEELDRAAASKTYKPKDEEVLKLAKKTAGKKMAWIFDDGADARLAKLARSGGGSSLGKQVTDKARELAIDEFGRGTKLTKNMIDRFIEPAAKAVVEEMRTARKNMATKALKGRKKRTIDYKAVAKSAEGAFKLYATPGSEKYDPVRAQKMWRKAVGARR